MLEDLEALACEAPSRLGVPLSRLHGPDIATQVMAWGIVAEISGTTVWRWLSEDAIRPWAHRSWIFPRDQVMTTEPYASARRVFWPDFDTVHAKPQVRGHALRPFVPTSP